MLPLVLIFLFLSTLSLRRATACQGPALRGICISIHALLAESDPAWQPKMQRCSYFYPRSPCGERLPRGRFPVIFYLISIHALLAESDTSQHAQQPKQPNFYPRSPCGERPQVSKVMDALQAISIHALLAESDSVTPELSPTFLYFYPRSPCGERRAYVRF